MLTHPLFSIAISLLLGFLTGLGTGGGSLLMVWLTVICDIAPTRARLINLMFFIPCAAVATVKNLRKGRIQIKSILLPLFTGCACAIAVTILSKNINTEQLRKLFGVLLLFTGLRELFYRDRNPR